MKQKFDAFVQLDLDGGHWDIKGQVESFERWMFLRDMKYDRIDIHDRPAGFLMMAEDALVFKLTFGL